MEPKLSILIASLEDRGAKLRKLHGFLERQEVTGAVEILLSVDNGEKTTGQKRNELMMQAAGEYIVYVDDDDLVSPDYVIKILEAIDTHPDCCGMEGVITFAKTGVKRKFIHSMRIRGWYEREGIYFRCPNHINPVKRSLALQAKFPDLTWGEDRVYSDKLSPLLQTEVMIMGPIYFYNSRD